jgi:hypothetical protein
MYWGSFAVKQGELKHIKFQLKLDGQAEAGESKVQTGAAAPKPFALLSTQVVSVCVPQPPS